MSWSLANSRRVSCIAMLCAAVLASASWTLAKEPRETKTGKAAGEKQAASRAADEDEAATVSYDVPDTKNVNELMRFMEQVRTYRPKSQEDAIEHRKMAPTAIRRAAEKVLKLEKDPKSENYQSAHLMLLVARASTIEDDKPAEQRELIREISEQLNGEESQTYVGLAMMIVQSLEHAHEPKIAAEAYRTFGAALKKSKDKQLAELASRFEGSARRVELVGKPMKVEGKTIDGKKLDWNKYQGKVVLVDFFATWCGPCREELPNIERAYRLYHDRGFEVIGVSVDEDTAALKKYLAETKLPWVTLHDVDDADNHPLSDYYGILGVPTVILIGKNGKVASLTARGHHLEELLTELIGPSGDDEEASEGAERANSEPKNAPKKSEKPSSATKTAPTTQR